MKKESIAVLASLAFAGMLSAQNVIRIGGVDFTPSFADSTLSQTNKTIICEDLERYFSYSGTLELMFGLSVWTENIPPSTLINSGHNDNIWTNVTIESMASMRLNIPKPLSDTYTNIMASTPASTSLLASARAFVGTLNDGSVSNRSDTAMQRLFRSTELVPETDPPELIRKSVVEMWGARQYVLPTIIEFSMAELSPRHPPVPTYALTTVSSATNGLVKVEKYMIAYDGAEWFIVEL